MHVFFSVGEPSGDHHAAQLMRALGKRVPQLRCSGFGGVEMEGAGLESLFRLTDMAVMGIGGILPLIRKFHGLYRQAGDFLERERPAAVVLVDYPGFNWWIAKAAKSAGIPVYYYCPPQLWAWAPWRIRKVHRYVDCILSVLPFEANWYREHGVDVEYVGHPFFDEVATHPLDVDVYHSVRMASGLSVGLLPGSRKQEVNRNFPMMLNIVESLHRRHPQVRFPVACYKQWHHDRCAELLRQHKARLPVDLFVGKTSEVMEAADCCLMVSGSVSLEMLARKTPAVVVYRAGFLTYWIARLLGTCDYITLPNLIADRPVMPEFPCYFLKGRHVRTMTEILDNWLSDPSALSASRNELTRLADGIVRTGGVTRAADVLASRLTGGVSHSHADAA